MESLVFYNHQNQKINEITGTTRKNNYDDRKNIKLALQIYFKKNGYSQIHLM